MSRALFGLERVQHLQLRFGEDVQLLVSGRTAWFCGKYLWSASALIDCVSMIQVEFWHPNVRAAVRLHALQGRKAGCDL